MASHFCRLGRIVFAAIFFASMTLPTATTHAETQPPEQASPEAKAVVEQFMKGESVFIQNSGQWKDEDIRFALNSMGANVGLTDTGPRFQLFRPSEEPASKSSQPSTSSQPSRSSLPGRTPSDPAIQQEKPAPAEMREFRAIFEGANKIAPEGRDKSGQTFNYLVGEVKNQRQNVPSFGSVWYKGLYPGIDLELKGKRTGLKYNFHVAPGADWQAIQIRYDGIEKLSLKEDGALQIDLAKGWSPLTDGAPYIYQEVDGQKVQVSGRYRLINEQTYGFEVTGEYDKTKPLVIDPEVVWGSYLGGTSSDYAYDVELDTVGNICLTGKTASAGWISGGWNPNYANLTDGFVVKLSSTGNHLWSTYIGGTGIDNAWGIAVDGSGNIYATGTTESSGWVSGGWDTSYGGGEDAYVVKLDSSGTHLWSTYLGGTSTDEGWSLEVDATGNVCVTGETSSSGWISGGWDTTRNATDGYVVKLNSAGDHLWSTYLGGTSVERGYGVDFDSSGSVYAVGYTYSLGWVSGGWDTTATMNGATDGYIVKLDPNGMHQWSSYIGGDEEERSYGVEVDVDDNVYITGYTHSIGWVSGGWDTSFNGGYDIFVLKLNSAGEHQWSSYFGDGGNDMGQGVAVDSSGNVYIVADTYSSGFTNGGWDISHNGNMDGCMLKLSSSGAHLWSSYWGASGYDDCFGLALDGEGNVYAVGFTENSGWISGGWDNSYGGGYDGYVLKVSDILTGSLLVRLSPDESVVAGAQWRRRGTTTWYCSDQTETNVPVGEWKIECKPVFGWAEPALTASVESSATAEVSGNYLEAHSELFWGSYLGEIEFDSATSIAVDGDGNIYVVGQTNSSGWISNGWDATLGGDADGFVIKLSSSGDHLWSSYIGGDAYYVDSVKDIAIDDVGDIYIAGLTHSAGWTSGGWDTSFSGDGSEPDGFVVKLDATGSHVWSSYIGGNDFECCYGIALGATGNICLTGSSYSAGWVSGGWDTTFGGNATSDGFVVVLNSDGEHLWSSYLGGGGYDFGNDISVDEADDVYVTGTTRSSNWVSGSWDLTYDGFEEGFVVKLNALGAHQWSTYLGGLLGDRGRAITLDPSGHIYVAGGTASPYWISGGWDTSRNGDTDGFLVKITPAGEHVWSSYIGGMLWDEVYGIDCDVHGNVYVTGRTSSDGWAVGGWDTRIGSSVDGFVAEFAPSGTHVWSSYVGADNTDECNGIAVVPDGNLLVSGVTRSEGWLTGGYDTTYAGLPPDEYDGFVALIRPIHRLIYKAGANGSIAGTIYQTIVNGMDGTAVTAVADADYHFFKWSDESTDNPRTDANVQSSITVTAIFVPDRCNLDYFADANGAISGNAHQIVDSGANGTAVTAVPDPGYHFVQWSDGVLTATRQDLNVIDHISVTASFSNTYTLDYAAGPNGAISGDAHQVVVNGTNGTAVEAVPETGFRFVKWSDASTENPRTDTNVSSNITVTAEFTILSFSLDYAAGMGGTVTGVTHQTVNYGSDGTSVQAFPSVGYRFVKWSDDSTQNPRTDTSVTASVTVTAVFAILTYSLDYTEGPNGTISGQTHQVVNFGANGSAVEAVPNTGYCFVKWSDDSTDNPRTDTNVTANISVMAEFAVNTYTLDYAAGANGSISGEAHQVVEHGSNGTEVEAVPDPGYGFVQWSDGVLTATRTDVNVTNDIAVTATFIEITLPWLPIVSGTASPTFDLIPEWSWTSGGGGGNGTFRYQLDSESGSWTETAELSWTPASALTIGEHTLYVQERDGAGNWSASGSFAITIQASGSIQITILPASAVTAGGKWRRVGTSTWLDSDSIDGPLAVGPYEIEFSAVPTLRKPNNLTVTVTADQTVTDTGTYGETGVDEGVWIDYR